MTDDYLRYFDLESYVFVDVRARFFRDGKLDAFDLFSIFIWKANRAKSKLAHRLIAKRGTLEAAAEAFTRALHAAPSAEARLLLAMRDWNFRLPMATAILSVLWPEDITVYDIRVCDELGDFHRLDNLTATRVWGEYLRYRQAVINGAPDHLSLRDKDRFLWGRSAAKQLEADIKAGFPKREKSTQLPVVTVKQVQKM